MPSIFRTSIILSLVFFGACERHVEVSGQRHWYDAWLNHSTTEAYQEFHSEIEITSGEKASLIINCEAPIIVGYFVKDGYEVTNDEGTIYMGTFSSPRMVGASPGSWREFSPEGGEIEILFENTSSIDTLLAVYTSTAKK